MPFDPTTLLDASHLASFLGGAAVGAAGTYMADRFTDRRRENEGRNAAAEKFERVSKHMVELLAELRKDLHENAPLVVRELVVLPSERITFNHDKPRIEVYETRHPAAKNQVGLLVSEGYLEVIRSSGTPIYGLTERFVESLEHPASRGI
jgi:hypothetical protein